MSTFKILVSVRNYRAVRPVFGFRGKEGSPKSFKSREYDEVARARAQHPNLYRLIHAYQELGHLSSSVNPLKQLSERDDKLQSEYYGLSVNQHELFDVSQLINANTSGAISLHEIVAFLNKAYCGNLTGQFSYLPMQKRDWLAFHLEGSVKQSWSSSVQIHVAKLLLHSEMLDNFLAKKFPTLKRYGLEGAEGQLAFFFQLINSGRDLAHWTDVVMGMTHRGRLNILSVLFNTPPSLLFHKINGGAEMEIVGDDTWWTGDVLSHLQCTTLMNNGVHVSIMPNPSHLELTNPVSMGNTRAKQLIYKSGPYATSTESHRKIVNVQVHGDAALAGQGVNQETLAMSRVPHFTVDGSIHLVVNNQLGFTTPAHRSRSSTYPSDLAKAIEAPILLVNGDDPSAVMRAAEISVKYVTEFEEDIFVEMQCYRRHGHNELDDPTVTNPDLYHAISSTSTLPTIYIDHLIDNSVTNVEEVLGWKKQYTGYLNDEFKKQISPPIMCLQHHWSGIQMPGKNLTRWQTGVDIDVLRYLGLRSVSYPEDMAVHEHLIKTHVSPTRRAMLLRDPAVQWATAEALAVASLLWQNFHVRISGQDVGRGTFAHRHIMLVDQRDASIHIPLNHCQLPTQQGYLEVANSILSEEAVMAYEFGMSIATPNTLVIWEAQFGDFMNGAQNVIDTYVSCSQTKWARCSSLTILLPHGYDGAGPDHSSARVERFLQLSNSSETSCDGDDVNFGIAWPSTPAQYFHVIRRQQIRNFRLPLVVITPKTLLRLNKATSRLSEMGPDSHWQDVIAEDNVDATRVVMCSGKHFYTLEESKPKHCALLRIESLVPFPASSIRKCLANYPHAKEFVWSQEEPRNMGAWSFIWPRLQNLVGINVKYAGIDALPTTAFGLQHLHKRSIDQILTHTFP